MRPLAWTAAWIGVAFWSFLVFGAWAMTRIVFGVARWSFGDEVPGFPVEPTSPTWLIDLLQGFGGVALFTVWAVVSAGILGTTWLVTSLFGRSGKEPGGRPR
ncbi:hypothetical protein ABB55_13035 [Prosthecomicrobium hirschii]|uniref:Uncharacterized protein n=1 Tax=Prosthecodimorpha hirschii TaxID=665126 RepID=A0A0P6W1I0_9HYPH|nr:hypothetical protein [Prosthecomicrobium hirschii]KPL53029.1 hypothetical protein ABB55_13035 [Prosthecomicrobium hirschii]TPQ52523.1 hypothetical protein C2U72_02805 [Prosthecomicrobium hirschii]